MLLKNSGHYCRMSLTLYFCHQSEVTRYWEGYHRGDKPFTAPHITSYMISKCLITDHVNLYHLDEVLCLLGLLIVKLLFFPLSFTSILGGRYSMQITFSPPYIPTNVLFISASCLQPLLCSSNGDFCSLILFFLKILFIYFQRKGKGGRKRGRETSVHGCLSHAPYWVPSPKTQACALTGNRTGNPLIRSLVLSPLSHTSQGCSLILSRFINWSSSLRKGCLISFIYLIIQLFIEATQTHGYLSYFMGFLNSILPLFILILKPNALFKIPMPGTFSKSIKPESAEVEHRPRYFFKAPCLH